jgi:hypothetical protein
MTPDEIKAMAAAFEKQAADRDEALRAAFREAAEATEASITNRPSEPVTE